VIATSPLKLSPDNFGRIRTPDNLPPPLTTSRRLTTSPGGGGGVGVIGRHIAPRTDRIPRFLAARHAVAVWVPSRQNTTTIGSLAHRLSFFTRVGNPDRNSTRKSGVTLRCSTRVPQVNAAAPVHFFLPVLLARLSAPRAIPPVPIPDPLIYWTQHRPPPGFFLRSAPRPLWVRPKVGKKCFGSFFWVNFFTPIFLGPPGPPGF